MPVTTPKAIITIMVTIIIVDNISGDNTIVAAPAIIRILMKKYDKYFTGYLSIFLRPKSDGIVFWIRTR